MSQNETRSRWIVPMKPRSPDEEHRVSTPLELLFDLVFVVAVSQTANQLHHGIVEGHIGETLVSYVLVFFGIWWAWMSFTWFASSYDTDDIPYRLLTFVQMTGALIIASGVQRVFTHQDLSVTVVGYVVMRIAGVAQWLRAARSDPEHRPAAMRYAIGTVVCQVFWVLLLFTPKALHFAGFFLFVLVEVWVPVWAERVSPTTWHVHHIRERYSLFTLIVLGEAILSTSVAIQSATEAGGLSSSLISVIVGGLLIVFAMWWLYFYQSTYLVMSSLRVGFIWAYSHVLIFGATAAVGAGLAVVIDQLTGHAEISATVAGLAIAVPSAIYVFTLWLLQEHPRANNIIDTLLQPLTAILILLTAFTDQAVLLTGILLVALVIIRLMRHLEAAD